MESSASCLLWVGPEKSGARARWEQWASGAPFELCTVPSLDVAERWLARHSAHGMLVDLSCNGTAAENGPLRLAALARRVPLLAIVADEDKKAGFLDAGAAEALTLDELATAPAAALRRLLAGATPGSTSYSPEAHAALRRSERERLRLATAVEYAAESIVITDPAGAIEYVNPAFEKITGYRLQEVVGLTPRLLKSGKHSPEFYAEMWATLARGQVWTGRFINRHREGGLLHMEATISPIRDEASGEITGYVAVERDTTEEHRLSSQLQQAQKMEALGQLASGVAHDFNNVLTAILGNLALAQHHELPERARPLLADAERASLRAAELVKQLLTFSRKSDPTLRPLRLGDVIGEVVTIARTTFDRRIEISAFIAEDLAPVVADAGQLHQVLLNLCVNARDALEALPTNARPAALRLNLEAENVRLDEDGCREAGVVRAGDYVRVSVSDNGIGMTEEVRKRVFEPFFTTKERGKGTGLGLATVYGIVKQHEGGVTLYSEPGYGSTFRVYLPAAELPRRSPSDESEEPPPGGSETILLVDDEEIIRGLCSSVLSRHGYRVLPAVDGRDALQIYAQREREIDLVVLDLSMPNLSGLETLERLRAFRPDVRVILSSGYSLDPAHDMLRQPCVAGFIAKPYQPLDLVRMVRQALDRPASST